MRSRSSALRVVLLSVLALVLIPSAAQAYTVTVNLHGAGVVDEINGRDLMYCGEHLLDNVAESTSTNCTAGTLTGNYAWGDVVDLKAFVTDAQAARGWYFSHWQELTGSGKIDCDPQGDPVAYYGTNCKFQIFENLSIDLYFNDDTAPNTTSLAGSPAHGARTNSTDASFTFDGSEPDARYDCKLDRPGSVGSWAACGSASDKAESYSLLTANGTYVFAVRARDPSGNVDGTPLSRSWVVDTVKPTTTITGGQSGITTDTSASFTFGAGETSSFFCSLDGSTPAACSSGVTYPGPLADGQHTFSVYAVDLAGNRGDTVSRSWTVDTTKPVTTITGGPSGASNSPDGEFSFNANEDTQRFECKLDDAAFEACTSPRAFSGLSDGAHSFAVRAVDVVGNIGDPVIRTWTIDRTAPDTAITGGPAEGSTLTTGTATFEFSSPDPSVTFECRIDTEAFAACTSPYSRENIANGDHVFEVRARDAGGNTDSTPARRTWRVNTLDGDLDGFERPGDCDDTNPAINRGATDIPDNGIDEDCSGADAVDPDRDRDGAARPLDCNDGDAAIRPGAPDAPRDGIDQDCDGKDADYALVGGALRYQWQFRGALTRAKVLRLSALPAGSRVRVTCKGRGCPFRVKRSKPSSQGAVDIRRMLKKRWLRAGTRVEIRVTAPGLAGRLIAFKTRKGKAPAGGKLACTAPGTTKTISCPAA